jgi:hypothetical protein
MKTTQALIPLFKQFIKESENGKRLKKNGERITKGSIDNYRYVLQNLIQFSSDTNFELRVCNIRKLTEKELVSEKNYWKKFYKTFTEFMYKKGCFDNYVGANIKVIRVFFNYLQSDKDIFVGDFHKQFYVRKEEVDILVLSPDQLKFLIHDKEFENSLTPAKQKVKEYLDSIYLDFEVVITNSYLEGEEYYVFFYNSKEYIENNDDSYALMGNSGIIVDKTNTCLYYTSTSYPIDYFIKIFLRNKDELDKIIFPS